MPTVVVFSGEYDLSSITELRRELRRLTNTPALVLDLSEVTFIDSAVLVEFVRFHEARLSCGVKSETILVPRGSPIRRLLELTRFAPLFDIVERLGTTRPQVVEYAFTTRTFDAAARWKQPCYRGPERRAITRDRLRTALHRRP